MIKITAAGTFPDSWKELCLISVIPFGGSAIDFCAMTEDITAMEWGSKGINRKVNVKGGNIVGFESMDIESVTLKCYPLKADDATTDSVIQLFHKQSTADTTQPIAVDNTLTRQKFGIVFLWATTLPATAVTVPGDSIPAYRMQMINAYMTDCKPDYSNKELSYDITFKWAPFQRSASANKREESTDGSVPLPAAITTAISF